MTCLFAWRSSGDARRLWLSAAGLLLITAQPARALPPDAEACLACHADKDVAPAPRLEGFDRSAHAGLSCASCHADAAEAPHPSKPGRVDCGACHSAQAAAFASSVHGKAVARGAREAPVCTDCHGEHAIRPPGDKASSVWRGAVSQTCSGCHGSERIAARFGVPADRVRTFLDSYHGLAGRSGELRVANCASCHGWHDVLPSSEPRSRIHPSNLAGTCGQCHPGAGSGLSSGNIHLALAGKGGASSAAGLVRTAYLLLIPALVLGMLAHNAADLLRKTLSAKPLGPLLREEGALMTLSERLQHGALIASFLLLAYSGFALKHPGSWWTLPLSALGGEEPRRAFHRAAALAFVAVALLHAGYLTWTRRGRGRLRALWPARRDMTDPVRLFLFNVGWSQDRPLLERFSYVEKAEYWSLVWGSCVMVLTGTVLVFHNFALAHFPLWVIEVSRVAHYLEAVLACLAILVWHLYWVVYDPDVYPMNWAWLTGRARLGGRRPQRGPDG